MDHRTHLPHNGAPCHRNSGFACDGRCQNSDAVYAAVLLGIMDASFTRAELLAYYHAADAAMLDR